MKKMIMAMALVLVMLAMLVMAGCGGNTKKDDTGSVPSNNASDTKDEEKEVDDVLNDLDEADAEADGSVELGKSDIAELIKSTLDDANEDWEMLSYYDEEEDGYYLFITCELTDEDCENVTSDQWSDLADQFDSVSESCKSVYTSCGYDIPCTVVLMTQEENIVLISTDGENTYSLK